MTLNVKESNTFINRQRLPEFIKKMFCCLQETQIEYKESNKVKIKYISCNQ